MVFVFLTHALHCLFFLPGNLFLLSLNISCLFRLSTVFDWDI